MHKPSRESPLFLQWIGAGIPKGEELIVEFVGDYAGTVLVCPKGYAHPVGTFSSYWYPYNNKDWQEVHLEQKYDPTQSGDKEDDI